MGSHRWQLEVQSSLQVSSRWTHRKLQCMRHYRLRSLCLPISSACGLLLWQIHKCHHGYPQNCNFKGCGAFTGEMSVEQMKDMGITNVMIGHSERRGEFGIFKMDDDSTLATKLKYILDAGMTCCFALGEPLPVREQGLEKVLELMDTQLSQIYSLLDPKKVVLAYEPVWAIGTGKTATPEDAQATHNAGNAAALSAMEDIDGFLVGGASMKPEIKEIVDALAAAEEVRQSEFWCGSESNFELL